MRDFQNDIRNYAGIYFKAYQFMQATPDYVKFINDNYQPNDEYNIRIESRVGQLPCERHELEGKVLFQYRVIITNQKSQTIETQTSWYDHTRLSQIEYNFSYAKHVITNFIKAWNNE